MLEPDQPHSPGKEITENPLAFIHVIKFLMTSEKTPMNEKLSFFNHPKAFVVTNQPKKNSGLTSPYQETHIPSWQLPAMPTWVGFRRGSWAKSYRNTDL